MSESGMPGGSRRKRFDREAEYRDKFDRFDRRYNYAGWRLRVEQIAHPDHLFFAYRKLEAEGGAAPGLDGVTYDDLSGHEVGHNLREVSKAILLAGTYRPALAREKRIAKSTPGQYRTLRMRNLLDRIVGKALQIATRPFWEYRFPRYCYAYRPKRGTWDMLAAVEVAMRRTGRRVLAIDDVKNAFDTVPIDVLVKLHRRALERVKQKNFSTADRNKTAALFEVVLRGDDPKRITGIDQGGCYSPTALNVLLGYELDRPLSTIPLKPHSFRYSDNIAYLVERVSDGQSVLEQANNLLQPLGMSLKGADGVYDLSNGESATLLGYDLRWDDGGLELRPSAKAWTSLRKHLQDSYGTPVPSRTALQQLRSWVTAYAPAVTDSDVGKVLSIAAEYGFREFRSKVVIDAWEPAWERWKRCRARASRRYRPIP
ncbi:MAG: reverse transcriptase domain-containing protein [Gemmataceae bacterium]